VVTGVQTCALPISGDAESSPSAAGEMGSFSTGADTSAHRSPPEFGNLTFFRRVRPAMVYKIDYQRFDPPYRRRLS
jgi:hypothetical protein